MVEELELELKLDAEAGGVGGVAIRSCPELYKLRFDGPLVECCTDGGLRVQ